MEHTHEDTQIIDRQENTRKTIILNKTHSMKRQNNELITEE